MKKAALYVQGKIVTGDSHLEAYQKLNEREKDADLVSGFFDQTTQEFHADQDTDHFYNKEIFLVRHAESIDPSEPDAPISERGQQQIQRLATVMLNFDLKDFLCLTSPLLRCLQTSLVLHEVLHIDFHVRAEIMETPCFLVQNQNYRLQNYKNQFQNYKNQFPHFDWPTEDDWILSPESERNFVERTRHALQDFAPKTIVVTHCGFIFNLARFATCDERAREIIGNGIPPASLTLIDRREIKMIGRTYAENTQG